MQTQGRQYLYKLVCETLKNEILDETYPYGIILPSEREISLRFEVDRTTVRKALECLVSEGLVEKRVGVGTSVIYKPNGQRSPSPADDRLVGFFVMENGPQNKTIAQPFYSDLFYQVEDQCKKHSANVIYSTIKSMDDLVSTISNRSFSGVVFASKTEDDYVKVAQEYGVKATQILGYSDRGLSICYDSAAAGKIAVDYLVENGHQNIALITGPNDFYTTENRLMGVLQSLYNHKLSLDRNHIFEGNWEYEGGYECAQRILALKDRPTAIYCFNDMMALGAMQAIADSGLHVPQDISLIGSDNMSKLRSSGQRITTTDAHIPSLAEAAIDYFFNSNIRYIDGVKIIIPVTFVEGDTVRNLRHPD